MTRVASSAGPVMRRGIWRVSMEALPRGDGERRPQISGEVVFHGWRRKIRRGAATGPGALATRCAEDMWRRDLREKRANPLAQEGRVGAPFFIVDAKPRNAPARPRSGARPSTTNGLHGWLQKDRLWTAS